MDFNLPLYGFYTGLNYFFVAYVLLSVVPVAKFLYQKNNKYSCQRPEVFLKLLGKVGLDIALIMGVSADGHRHDGQPSKLRSGHRRHTFRLPISWEPYFSGPSTQQGFRSA